MIFLTIIPVFRRSISLFILSTVSIFILSIGVGSAEAAGVGSVGSACCVAENQPAY